jgi:predicted dehydrogenase
MKLAEANTVAAVDDRGSALPRPPKKPRLAFVGLGWIGENRLASIARANNAEISAIVDPSNEMLGTAAQHAPDALRFNRFDDLFSLDLDAVVIATPSAQHAAQSIAALKQGLAVFCQKPLGRNLAEVRAVIEAARSANRLLGVDLSYRHTEALEGIRALIQTGELGEIFGVDLVFHNAYGPQKPWFYDRCQAGGGCVVDLGIHLVDAALWILEQPVVAVNSRLFRGGKRIIDRATVCEDYASARLDLATGTTIDLTCSWHLHAGRDAIIEAAFYGTKGGAAMHNFNGSFYDFVAERFTHTSRETLTKPPDEWFGRAAVRWVETLAANPSYDSKIEPLIEVHRALDAIYENANA